MSRSRQTHTNFSAGVISPEAEARIDSPVYTAGLSEGRNVIIKTTGGLARRPGSLFMRDYGTTEHMRIFPFIFNNDQKYVIVIYLDEPDPVGAPGVYDGLIDVYRDNVLVLPGLVTPYNTERKIREIDTAQSADTMVFVQGDHEPQLLRRLGADNNWEFVDAPIINPPCESMMCEDDGAPGTFVDPTCTDGSTPYCGSGECADGTPPTCAVDFTLVTLLQWTDINGWPRHVTFHQGRLWFAGSTTYPQSVWASKAQDFYNFDVGVGDPADSVQETLDTDFINPIQSIFSAGRLMVFTSGAEFFNKSAVITPTTSAWLRQTTYGSSTTVRPVSVDGSVLFLDNTERIFRQFTYNDTIDGYDSPSISSESEHLIKAPVAMGEMRGGVSEPSNFVYVVNGDGSMAVLNVAKAYQVNAWVAWETQGFYQDVMDLDRELYVLVKRYVYNELAELELHWMLELVTKKALTDSASINESLTETTITGLGKSDTNFFGVYYAPNSNDGKVVIVMDGVEVYRADFLKNNPLEEVRNVEDIAYSSGNVFNVDEKVRELYFDVEVGYRWYMHTVSSLQLVNHSHNYIDGLTHLIGQEVVAVLDGNAYMDEIVVPGDTQDTVENSYPDGVEWEYDETAGAETYILRHTSDNTTIAVEAFYNGVHYGNLQKSQHGYLISGVDGQAGAEYLQEGVNESTNPLESEFTFSDSGSFNVLEAMTTINYEVIGAGGAGGGGEGGTGSLEGQSGDGSGGGGAGVYMSGVLNVVGGEVINFTIGKTGSVGAGGAGADSCSGSPGQGTAGKPGVETVMTHNATTVTSGGGYGGILHAGLGSNGAPGESSTLGGGGAQGAGSGGIGGTATGYGAGGGGGAGGNHHSCDDGDNGGAGGPGSTGVVKLVAPQSLVDFKHRTRKMVLVGVEVTDGIVIFPEDPYILGEAGLFFDVKAVTLPINVSAGGGSLINEPKRVVAVTAKFLETQGLEINGISIPERQFGEEVFDREVPKLSGIDKIRLLGYNRDTRIYISQDTPMPMTLLSLDIEVNY